jgi:hypothetical protein
MDFVPVVAMEYEIKGSRVSHEGHPGSRKGGSKGFNGRKGQKKITGLPSDRR